MSGKLIFYFGTVNSSKSMMLLAIGHNYDSCGWKVCAIKPDLDTRSELIETRAKVPPRKANIIVSAKDSLYDYYDIINECDVILVDECQFLTESHINELRNISSDRNIDVLCFGLRTDFNTKLFPASKRLFELADEINEVKTICNVCGKKAGFNAKLSLTDNCSNIEPGWDNFEQRCWKCYSRKE